MKIYDRTGGVRRTENTAHLGTGLCTPRRRPPKGQLTARQKTGNRRVSRRRIVVEHGIGKIKVWCIASERYRNAPPSHPHHQERRWTPQPHVRMRAATRNREPD